MKKRTESQRILDRIQAIARFLRYQQGNHRDEGYIAGVQRAMDSLNRLLDASGRQRQ